MIVPALVNRSFATVIDADVPIVAERAMYFGDSPLWLGGHGSAGVAGAGLRLVPCGRRDRLAVRHVHPARQSAIRVDVLVTVIFTTDSGVTVTRSKTVPAPAA